jgi:hypothetical protein
MCGVKISLWLTTPGPKCDPNWSGTQKRAAVAGGSKVNREASNRVDRSHSMSRTWTTVVIVGKA